MVNNKKIIIVTQARIGSSRLPNKVLLNLGKKKMIEHHLDRLKKVSIADGLIVATTNEKDIKPLIDLLKEKKILFYQGSTNNVLERFYKAVLMEEPDYVVRVTSDCPLIDPILVSEVIKFTINGDLDYGTNILEEMFPDGQDIEVIKFSALKKAYKESKLKSDLEHVTPFIRRNSTYLGGEMFSSNNYSNYSNYSSIRMTVDELKDLESCEVMIQNIGNNGTWKDYADFIIDRPSLFSNQQIKRNEGLQISVLKEKK